MRLPHKAVYGQANILSRVLHRDQYVIVCVSASLLLGLAPRHNDVAHKLGPRPRAIMDPGVREGGPAGESEPRCPLRCASKQASLRVSAPWRSQLIGSTLAAHAVRDLPLLAPYPWPHNHAEFGECRLRSDRPRQGQRTSGLCDRQSARQTPRPVALL